MQYKIRCSLCGKEFDPKDDSLRLPEHTLGSKKNGPRCSNSYGYGYVVNKEDYNPRTDTTKEFRQALLPKT